MGIVVRQSAKASLVNYIGVAIGYFNVVYLYPYCLNPEIIGLNKILIDSAIFLAFFVQLSVPQAAIKFFPFFKDEKQKHHGFFLLLMIFPIIGLLIFGSIFFLFNSNITTYFITNAKLFTDYIYIILPLTIFITYINILETYATLLLRIAIPRLIREIVLRLLNILIIVLFYFRILSLSEYILCLTGIYLLVLILNLFYLSKVLKISFKPDFKFLDKKLLKQILAFTSFVMISGIGANIVYKIDVFMISSKINLANTGIYTIAFYIITIIEIPARAILSIISPIVSESINKKDFANVDALYKKTALNEFLMGGFLFLLVWINIDNIFKIMPSGHLYQSGKYVILFLGASKMIEMLTSINGIILINSKWYFTWIFFTIYLAIISIIGNNFLIPIYGIIGSSIATLLSIGTYNLFLVMFLWIKMKSHPFSFNQVKVLAIITILFLINIFIPNLNIFYLDSFFRSGVIATFFFLIVYKTKISTEINQIINQTLNLSFIKNLKIFRNK